jgi:hypothetical protein
MNLMRIIIAHRTGSLSRQLVYYLAISGLAEAIDVHSLEELERKAIKWNPNVVLIDIYFVQKNLPGVFKRMRELRPGAKLMLMGPGPQVDFGEYAEAVEADYYLSDMLPPVQWLKSLNDSASGLKG